MGIFDFLANAPAGSPDSYTAQQMRQKIALAMMAQGGRKGYPKTLGEGLTAIGDAFGDIGSMRALQQTVAQEQAAREIDAGERPAPPPGKRTEDSTTGPPPVATAALQPKDDAEIAPVSRPQPPPPPPPPSNLPPAVALAMQTPNAQPAQSWSRDLSVDRRDPSSFPGPDAARPNVNPTMVALGNDAYRPGAPGASTAPWLSGASGAYGYYAPTGSPRAAPAGPRTEQMEYPQTASLATGTMSDAPPIGIRAQQPSVFPPPAAAGLPASTLAAMQLTSPPEAAGNRPIVLADASIAPQRFQQPAIPPRMPKEALPADQPVVPQTSSPLPAKPQPGVYDTKEPPPARPDPVLPDDEQAYYEKMAVWNRKRGGDPAITQGYEEQAKNKERERLKKDALQQTEYQSQLATHNARMLARERANVELPVQQEQLKQERYKTQRQQEEDALKAAWGNLPPQAHTYLGEQKKNTVAAVSSLEGMRNAREAMDAGTVFGVAAPAKLLYYQGKAELGDANAARIVAATQTFKTALGPLAAQAIRAYGGAQISNLDQKIGMQMSGGDYTQDEKTARRMLDIAERSASLQIKEHRENLDKMLKDQPGEARLRLMYDVPDPQAAVPFEKPVTTDFKSMEDAEAAKLPRGTKFTINGKKYKVQ